MEKKICTKCKVEKSSKHYYFNSSHQKYESVCKECGVIRCREWRKNNPQKAKQSSKQSKEHQLQANPLLSRTLQLASSMTTHSKNKKIKKELNAKDIRDLYNKQNGKCYYTGIKMKLVSDKDRDLLLMSIDRLDSCKGYVNENVVLCCWGMNVLKGPHSKEELFCMLKLFYKGAKALGVYTTNPNFKIGRCSVEAASDGKLYTARPVRSTVVPLPPT